MIGSYEVFILVKVKDGREFVCALNRQKDGPFSTFDEHREKYSDEQCRWLEKSVVWN